MKADDVPDNLINAAIDHDLKHRGRGNWQRVPDKQVARLIAGALTALDDDVLTPGTCACRVHKGETTVDWALLHAVPDNLVDAFDQGSTESAHACTSSSPIASEDAYVRGGLAAALALTATRYEQHLLMLASGCEEIAYDGGMPGASKTGAGSPRDLRADARFLRELAKDTSWITGGDR